MSGDMRTWATMGDNAQTWRVVDDRGEAHEVTISPARWPGQWYVTATGRLRTVAASTARSAAATVAAMHFAVAEIRGPGEKTTAEQLAELTRERDAALAAVDAVRADYAPRARATPPTVDEVRALSVKQCREDVMAQVLVRDGLGDWYLCMLGVRSGAVYGLGRSDDLVMRRSDGWLAIGPDGLVPWSELARLVAQGGV